MKLVLPFLSCLLLPAVTLFISNELWSQSASSGNSAPHSPPSQSGSQVVPPPTPVKKKAGKVWTNEDVGGLTGNVSVVGNPGPAARADKIEDPPQKPGEGLRDAAYYRKQLSPLHAQLESMDRDIQKLKNFKGSNAAPEGGIRNGGRYNMTPLEEQIRQIEAKKKSLQSNIDDIEREARHHGIEPAELR